MSKVLGPRAHRRRVHSPVGPGASRSTEMITRCAVICVVLTAAGVFAQPGPAGTREQCFPVTIGTGDGSPKSVTLPANLRLPVTCPTVASRANWVRTIVQTQLADVGDTFSVQVTQNAGGTQTVTATRTDAPGSAWGLNLAVTCCYSPCFQLVIGTGTAAGASATLPADRADAMCPRFVVNTTFFLIASLQTHTMIPCCLHGHLQRDVTHCTIKYEVYRMLCCFLHRVETHYTCNDARPHNFKFR